MYQSYRVTSYTWSCVHLVKCGLSGVRYCKVACSHFFQGIRTTRPYVYLQSLGYTQTIFFLLSLSIAKKALKKRKKKKKYVQSILLHRISNFFCARNSQRSLPRQGRDHLFQWDVWISVGFFTETTGSLRNPETLRNPSHF